MKYVRYILLFFMTLSLLSNAYRWASHFVPMDKRHNKTIINMKCVRYILLFFMTLGHNKLVMTNNAL